MKKIYICFLALISLPLFSKEDSESYFISPSSFDLVYNGIYPISNVASSFFPNDIFENRIEKVKYLSELDSFYYAYKDFLPKIEFVYFEKDYDIIFYFDENNKFYFSSSKKYIENRDFTPSLYFYPKSNKNLNQLRFSKFFYQHDKESQFFHLIYGKNPKEIKDNLVDVNIFGRVLPFNSKNGASENLKKAIDEIEYISKTDDKVKEWIKSIKVIFTYMNRKIDRTDRTSIHSFGIAVDFIPKNNKKQIYWLWSRIFFKEWWSVKDEDRYQIPSEVVSIFEKYGFSWGGKWKRFDIMHFEYRPDLTNNRFYF